VQSQVIQESAVQVRYGGWQGVNHSSANGGTYRQSAVEDATARFSLTGTEVAWITAQGTDKGIAEVSIDEVSQGIFDLYSPTTQWQVAYTFSGLPYGSHTLAVRVTGAKNAASTGQWVVVDAFRVP
jgi:bacillopeptidase F